MIKTNEELQTPVISEKNPWIRFWRTQKRKFSDCFRKKVRMILCRYGMWFLSVIDKIEMAAKHKGTVTGLATGFYDLDYKTSGFQPSDLILVAARPSMGKTAFVLNLAQYIAVKNKVPTVIFSLEMSKDQLVNRLLSMESKVDSQLIRTGNLSANDWEKLIESAGDTVRRR